MRSGDLTLHSVHHHKLMQLFAVKEGIGTLKAVSDYPQIPHPYFPAVHALRRHEVIEGHPCSVGCVVGLERVLVRLTPPHSPRTRHIVLPESAAVDLFEVVIV